MRAIAILCSLTVLLTSACGGAGGGEQAAAPPPPSVRTAQVKEEFVTFYDKYPATVTPLELVEVRPQTSGYITRVHFQEGDYVRQGQRLYTVDTRRYAADVDQAQAQVATARANLALAEKNVARYRRLAEAEAIALQTLDQSEAELEARRQDLERANASVRSARTQLSYTVIRAPLSGVTSLNSAKQGTQVSPGMPLLTTISQEKPIGVDFPLPQAEIPRLADLEAGGMNPGDSTFRVRLPNDSLYQGLGRVYASDRAVDPRTGSLNVRLEFDNENGVLRTGMSIELEMLNSLSGKQILIPTRSLGEQMGETYVMIVRDSVAYRQKVITGKRIKSEVVVLEGLDGDESVITQGLKGIKDSMRVTIVPAQTGGAAAGAVQGGTEQRSEDTNQGE